LRTIEWDRVLEYHVAEMRTDTLFVFLESLVGVDLLGTSATGKTTSDREYLVYPRNRRPAVRTIPQRRGGVSYLLDLSPETVQLAPGGLHVESGAIVAGRVAQPMYASANGKKLYRDFSQALLTGFRKVRGYWLGPEAFELFKAGGRLVTIGIRSPKAYDLAEPS
jgi:hypothetical protein